MLLAPGRLSRQSHQLPILYVDYLAIGPFNREPIKKPQHFRGLGTVLLGSAVNTSFTMGLEGRCGLHSLRNRRLLPTGGHEGFDRDATYMNLRYSNSNRKQQPPSLDGVSHEQLKIGTGLGLSGHTSGFPGDHLVGGGLNPIPQAAEYKAVLRQLRSPMLPGNGAKKVVCASRGQ